MLFDLTFETEECLSSTWALTSVDIRSALCLLVLPIENTFWELTTCIICIIIGLFPSSFVATNLASIAALIETKNQTGCYYLDPHIQIYPCHEIKNFSESVHVRIHFVTTC